MSEWSGSGGSEDEDGPDLQRAVVMDDDEVDQTKILVVAEISLGLCPGEEAGNTVECVPP